jgi:ribonuclease BN (tRNA processing enzyme)
VRLIILGSGTAIPHPKRGASGYACIASDGTALLLECGPGSTRRWPRHGIALDTVRGIVATHHHVDHVSDLGAVLFARNVPEPPVRTPLALVGPVGHARLVGLLGEAYGSPVSEQGGSVAVHELDDGGALDVGPFHVDARVVLHAKGSLGVRVTCEGRTLAFSGDSGPCEALVELCRGADLALLECSYPAARETKRHLNARTAAEVALRAGVTRLVLTHFYAQCDDADITAEVRAAGYANALHLAEDGDELEV